MIVPTSIILSFSSSNVLNGIELRSTRFEESFLLSAPQRYMVQNLMQLRTYPPYELYHVWGWDLKDVPVIYIEIFTSIQRRRWRVVVTDIRRFTPVSPLNDSVAHVFLCMCLFLLSLIVTTFFCPWVRQKFLPLKHDEVVKNPFIGTKNLLKVIQE